MNAAVCKTSVPHTIHLCPRKETWVNAHLIAMPKNKSLSLSDFMRGPDSAVRDFSEVQEDDDTEYVKEYGIGIDCHSKFIEVCVRYPCPRPFRAAALPRGINRKLPYAAMHGVAGKTDDNQPHHRRCDKKEDRRPGQPPACTPRPDQHQISDHPCAAEGLCPIPIPAEVRLVLRGEYEKYDRLTAQAEECRTKIFEKARSMEWETDTGTLPGDEMIRILATAPQVGELTAVIWLARVVTPRRFRNAKALAAYCGLDPSLKISAGKVTNNLIFNLATFLQKRAYKNRIRGIPAVLRTPYGVRISSEN